jgi:hypothetical protein
MSRDALPQLEYNYILPLPQNIRPLTFGTFSALVPYQFPSLCDLLGLLNELVSFQNNYPVIT